MSSLIKREITKLPGVLEVRGEGFLLGIVLDGVDSPLLVERARDRGLLLNAPNKGVIRIAPALTITDAQIKEFIKKFANALRDAQQEATS